MAVQTCVNLRNEEKRSCNNQQHARIELEPHVHRLLILGNSELRVLHCSCFAIETWWKIIIALFVYRIPECNTHSF